MAIADDTWNTHMWRSIHQATIHLLSIPIVIFYILSWFEQHETKSQPYLILKFLLTQCSRDKMVAILKTF